MTLFKKLLSEELGAHVKHHIASMPEEEDMLWEVNSLPINELPEQTYVYTGHLITTVGHWPFTDQCIPMTTHLVDWSDKVTAYVA